MDEEINIINENVKRENFFNLILKYKKIIYLLGFIIFALLIIFFLFNEAKNKKNIKIGNNYSLIKLNYKNDNRQEFLKELNEIINSKNKTYAPLALFFIIDNTIIENKNELNKLFDIILENKNFDQEVINLLIYKKALLNSDIASEIDLLNIIQPILNSNSIWKPHSLLLLGDYFLSKNEIQKSKDFYNQVLIEPNVNQNLSKEAQLKIRRIGGE